MGGSDHISEPTETRGPAAMLAATTGKNLLLVGPPMVGKRAFGLSVLAEAAENGRDVLVIATSRSVTSLPFDPNDPGRFGIVDCTPGGGEDDGPVVSVSSPGDLTGISMPVSRFLDGATRPVVLLDSVSSMLQYADEESTFRFLSVLTSNVTNGGGVGLYTFDDGVHTEKTYRTFSQLFDGRTDLRGGPGASIDSGGDSGGAGATEIRVVGVSGLPDGWISVQSDRRNLPNR